MTHTRPLQSWARLTAPGIPPFAVIRRPLRINFDTVLDVGAAYPAPAPGNFSEMRRARQLYQQRKIAPAAEVKPVEKPAVQVLAQPTVQDTTASLLPPEDTSASLLPAEHTASVVDPLEASDDQADIDQVAEQPEHRAHHKSKKGTKSHGSQ